VEEEPRFRDWWEEKKWHIIVGEGSENGKKDDGLD
jgi:hypothetical protein